MGELSWGVDDILTEAVVKGMSSDGQPLWSNCFFAEWAEPDGRLLKSAKWRIRETMDRWVSAIESSVAGPVWEGVVLPTSVIPYGMAPTAVVLVGALPNLLRFVQRAYYAYFAGRYPAACWYVSEKPFAPVHIRSEGRLVGAIMPIYVGDKAEQLGLSELHRHFDFDAAQLAAFALSQSLEEVGMEVQS